MAMRVLVLACLYLLTLSGTATAQVGGRDHVSAGGVFFNPLGLLVGRGAAELSFGMAEAAAINVHGAFGTGGSGDVEVTALGGGLGLQYFPAGRLYQGVFLYPQVALGVTSVEWPNPLGDGTLTSEATVFGAFGSLGYQWDWQPFSLRVGGGLGYVAAVSETSGDDGATPDYEVSGLQALLDASIGFTWGRRPLSELEAGAGGGGHRAHRGRGSRKRAPGQGRARRRNRVTTLAVQRGEDTQVEIEQASIGRRFYMRITRVGERGVLRTCPRTLLLVDDHRYRFSPDYNMRVVGPRFAESHTVQIDKHVVADIAAADAVSVDMCGLVVQVGPKFRRALGPAPVKHAPRPPAHTGRGGKGKPGLRARLRLDALDVLLQANPAEDADALWLGLSVPVRTLPPATQCPVVIVVDGEPMPALAFKHSASPKAGNYSAPLPLPVLEQLATAQRIAGQVCDTRFTLGEGERAALGRFLVRFKEERAFAEAAPVPAAPVPAATPDAPSASAGGPGSGAVAPSTEPAAAPAFGGGATVAP